LFSVKQVLLLVVYQGEELGMTNYPFISEKEFEDVEIRGLWKELVEGGTT
ncbi:oligo-1,6-glucosidase, partial [Lonsdalea quercina]